MYVLLGLCILLAAMLLINSIVSLSVSILWRGLKTGARHWSASSRASVIATLRILPVALGLAAVGLLFAPAYLTYEPLTDHEDVSWKLAIVAVFSAVGLALALWRGGCSWRATNRLTKDWMGFAKPILLPGITTRAYQFEHQFPVIAIVGTFRPRLFIARKVLESLGTEELEAAISHEVGHLVHGDNLKRGLLRACRDSLLIIPLGRSLDTAWKEASEEAADEYAARRGATAALDLASSLIKIARMIPAGTHAALPAGAFLVGPNDGDGVTTRVRRLLELGDDDRNCRNSSGLVRTTWVPTALMVFIIAVASTEPYVLTSTHLLIEEVVSVLK